MKRIAMLIVGLMSVWTMFAVDFPHVTEMPMADYFPMVTAGNVAAICTDVSGIRGKWESFIVATIEHPKSHTPLLVIVGSDRRGTAFGLTSLS